MSLSHVSSESTLNHLAFTQGLEPEEQRRIAELASLCAWDAGATVFREGDRDSALYLVEVGRVAIEISVPGRGRVTILTVGPGEVFGWSSLFFQRPKTASARTVEPTRALALDAARLRALCDADTRVGYLLTQRILQVVSERLQATRMQLLDIYGH
jgi:CRP/FNR family cyclic AMP-dependent transcriptional regulator